MKKEIELFLNDEGEWLENISLVEEPAIESGFLCFAKEEKMKFSIQEDRQIITGPVMIPEKRIVRYDEKTGEEYYVYFSDETICQAAHRWLQENMNHRFNLEHSTSTNKIDVVESWIVANTEMDKSTALGYRLPEGTWMISCKVNDEGLWKRIKEGEFNGFSVEGIFSYESFSKMTEKEMVIKEVEDYINNL